jgi:uncharacterized protein YjbI with pentapeptide repeats
MSRPIDLPEKIVWSELPIELRAIVIKWAKEEIANLSGAYLSGAKLSGADLSGVTGLLDAKKWIAQNFKADEKGIIVYKRIGPTQFDPPTHWKIETGAILTEVSNPDRCTECACGVNFGTLQWCLDNYKKANLWSCRINFVDLVDVTVPYNTDGKARCGSLELLEIVQP